MASNINPNNIDTAYPIAGQDNDSQGFRDNFTNIKTNFQYAEEEIDDLQSKVLLKSALTGTTLDNDMGGALLKNAKLQGTRYTRIVPTTTAGSITIDFSAGSYYEITTTGSVSLNFTNFPSAGNQASVQVTVTITDIAYTLTLPSAVGTGTSLTSLQNIIGRSGQIITFTNTGTYSFLFSTSDGGTTVYIEDLTRNVTSLSIGNLSDVSIANVANLQLLQYNSSSNLWVNATVTYELGDLSNVTLANVADNDILRYDSSANVWINSSEDDVSYPTTEYTVTVADDGSGTQEVFFFDGTAIRTNAGVITPIEMSEGRRYRFDVSDASNADAPLRFSTTPDTAVPASITPYTTNVTVSGTAGQANAFVSIEITPDTPSPLYFYAFEADPGIDTSLIGGAVANPVFQTGSIYTGSEELDSGDAANLVISNSYFATGGSGETATLAAGTAGQIKVLAMSSDGGGDMVVTVTNAGWKSSGSGTITFSEIGQSAMLQYFNSKWYVISTGPGAANGYAVVA